MVRDDRQSPTVNDEPDETEEEFWARVDPYGDRLARPVPLWLALIVVIALIAAIIGGFAFVWRRLHLDAVG